MKKVLSLLLAVLMVFTLLPVSALADGEQLTIHASSVTALVASEIEVEISAENNPGISGLQLQLEYDSSVLTLEEVNYADAATTGLIAQPSQKLESPVKLTWYNGTADSKYNGALATLRFSVSENAAEGSGSTLHLVIDGDNVSNLKEENIPFLAVDGEILIINYTPGDINNDQRVNVKDLIRLAQYLADWEVEVVDACLDTNGDGSINIKDLIRLAQYLADWEVELFPKAATSTCEHVLSAVEAKAATCVDEGNTAYWICSKCGKLFADAEGRVKTDLNTVKIAKNPNNHANVVIDPAVPATSTSTGLPEGSHCSADGGKGCGTVIVAQEIIAIPVKSHPAEKLHLVVNDGESFTLEGGEKNFADLTIESSANVTSLNNIYFTGNQSPLKISSQTVNLYRAEIRDSADLCMILNAPTTNLTLSGTNVMSSVRDNALLAKSVVVTYTNSGRLKLTGNLLINGTVNDEAGRISFVDRGEIVFINDEQFTQYARGMFTVAFDPNGGTVSEERKDCYFGEKIGELPVPTRRYYDFVGWYTEVEGGELLTEDSALPGNDNITLYAHWTRQTATVAFNANEGQCSESSRTVNCGDALGTLPVARRDYYTFLGWYTDPVNGEQIDEAKLIADTVPLMLYAHWEQKPQKGWALASAVPEGAQILDRKWSYSLTTYVSVYKD